MPEKKKCFVVMGFGTKTDYQQQKSFDLDKTYRIIIKKAVEDAGMECIRADEVVHSGVIDKPMYELLLSADVVVADLSTANPNAIYELGVRHALRPHRTIVIAEQGFKFPFDVNHLVIRPYKHLGEGIDAEDAEDVRKELTNALRTLADDQEVDSPVYTFLSLEPPSSAKADGNGGVREAVAAAVPAADDDQSASMLWDMFHQARASSNWAGAQLPLAQLEQRMPGDAFIVQQLALATYKSKQPDAASALEKATEILRRLDPAQSNDPETLGLWGAIHKRLWEESGSREALEEAVRSYGKGFYLKDDHYNGINYAFMLNVRASVSEGTDAVADSVWAERVRKRVIEICKARLAEGVKDDEGEDDLEELFWLRATMVEALAGSGQQAEADSMMANAVAEAPEDWMAGTLQEQLGKLQELMAQPST